MYMQFITRPQRPRSLHLANFLRINVGKYSRRSRGSIWEREVKKNKFRAKGFVFFLVGGCERFQQIVLFDVVCCLSLEGGLLLLQ